MRMGAAEVDQVRKIAEQLRSITDAVSKLNERFPEDHLGTLHTALLTAQTRAVRLVTARARAIGTARTGAPSQPPAPAPPAAPNLFGRFSNGGNGGGA